MTDLWASEDFEQRVTAATVALYETNVESYSDCNSIHRFDNTDLMVMRKQGIYITAPDRVVFAPGCGMSILKWPQAGCISVGSEYKENGDGKVDDLLESYCRLIYFRRLNKLPSHSAMRALGDPYEMMMAWPQDNGPVIGFTDYLTVNRRSGSVSRTVPAWQIKNPSAVSRHAADKENIKMEYGLSVAIQFTEDARHIWSITAHNDVSKVTVGAHAESVKSLLYARTLPMTKTGRKRPILHVVHAHRRRIAAGTDIDVRDFLRGTREVVMDDTKYTVSPPQVMLEEMRIKGAA